MSRFIALFLLFSSSLFAISADPSSSSFEMREKKRVDVFDFSESFLNLENIDIDARRKRRVDFFLTGDFPVLRTVAYEGSFGTLRGQLTGNYPELDSITFWCTSCAMDFDFRGNWHKSCTILIRGMKEDINLVLPSDVGIVVNAKVGARGKINAPGLKKKGVFGVWNKTLSNELAETAPIVLTFDIEATDGHINLKSL